MVPTASIMVHPTMMPQRVAVSPQSLDLLEASLPERPVAPPPRAVVLPAAVQKSVTVATVNPAILHLQDPQFRPVFIPPGQPRSSFSLPTLITPSAAPTDQTLFEEPQDPTRKHFLPHYSLATTASPQGPTKWVSLEPAATGFQLVVHLKDDTDSALAQGNSALPAAARYLLTANLQARVANWDLAVASNADGAALKLTLPVPDLAGRDLVYQAMTDPTAAAKLIVRRSVPLAIPQASGPGTAATTPPPATVVSSGQGAVLRGTWLFGFDTGAETNGPGADVWWEQQTAVQRALVPRGNAGIVNLGTREFDSLTLDQLRSCNYGVAPIPGNADASNQLVAGDVFAVHTQGGNFAKVQVLEYGYNLKLRWVTYGPGTGQGVPPSSPPTLYVPETIAIDTVVPFTFNKDLDRNVFARLEGAGAGAPATWNIKGVDWQGRRHTYYQSSSQPDQVYFLPDAFKVARQPEPPHPPQLAVQTNGEELDRVTLTLSYIAHPVWDPRRIQAAAGTLQQELGLGGPPSLALFQASNAKLALSLPSADASGGSGLVEQTGVLIDTSAGIRGSVTLPLAQFRQIYDALFQAVSPLLAGEVKVTVDNDVTTVPFTARASEFDGDVLKVESVIDATNNVLRATLRNVIESPIHFDGLKGIITKGGAPIASLVTAVQPQLPTDLPTPSVDVGGHGTLSVTLAPAPIPANSARTPTGGGTAAGQTSGAVGEMSAQVLDTTCAPLFDFSEMRVVPDSKAIWRAIMENQVVGPVSRTITLRTIAATLKSASATAGADRPMAIQVVFDNGQTVSFDASQTPDGAGFLNQTLKLNTPIETYVLGGTDTGTYRYRIDLVTGGGIKTGTSMTDNRDVIFVITG
jgi:hypothetical protein